MKHMAGAPRRERQAGDLSQNGYGLFLSLFLLLCLTRLAYATLNRSVCHCFVVQSLCEDPINLSAPASCRFLKLKQQTED